MRILSKKAKLLSAAILIAIFQLPAQISVDKNDMPSPGTIVRTSTGLNLDFIDYQQTGENYIWNFSQLTPISQSVDTFVSQMNAPLLYIPFFMFNSNLAKSDDSRIPIPNSPITNAYSFYKNTNSYFGVAGQAVMLYGIPIPLKFDSPDILYHFPMNYGNTENSYAEYGLGAENFGYIGKEISRSNTVDGWGTLTTPYGTFDVLRLKSEVSEFDTIYIDSLGTGLPIYRDYTEYSWLGKDQNIPLLKITSSFGGTIATYIDSLRFDPSSINTHIDFISDVKIFPNPTHDLINISFKLLSKSDVSIVIYNSSGVEVASNSSFNSLPGVAIIKMNLKQLGFKKGIYLLKLISDNQQITKKIILY